MKSVQEELEEMRARRREIEKRVSETLTNQEINKHKSVYREEERLTVDGRSVINH